MTGWRDALPSDGLLAVVKRDCPTCVLVAPVLAELAAEGAVAVTQDDPAFPEGMEPRHDGDLELSYRLDIGTVPTLIRFSGGREAERAIGWNRAEWRALTGNATLGENLPENQPGCGSLSVEFGMPERLAVRFGDIPLSARRIVVEDHDDPMEAAFDRGWTDGLPIVPPTDLRVARMLAGTMRAADEVIGEIPPNLAPCTVEKAAINAVMAGCRPDYFPTVLAAVEAALIPGFSMHGLLCTTHFAGPVIVVNGPVARRIGMNWGLNALGQGNRANATIGRAFQLIIRNVGGGRPGEIDRAMQGNPGKYTFCFAEDETDPDWTPLSVSRGIRPGASAVTLFHGEGVSGFVDQKSRTAAELTTSLAHYLWHVNHPKLCEFGGALLVLSPEHYLIYKAEGWGRDEIHEALWTALKRPGSDVVRGAGGLAEGMEPGREHEVIDKFREPTFLIARAGGPAGLFSAVIGGWTGMRMTGEVDPVTKEIGT